MFNDMADQYVCLYISHVKQSQSVAFCMFGESFQIFCLLLFFCSIMMLGKKGRKEIGRMNATDVPTAGRSHSNL